MLREYPLLGMDAVDQRCPADQYEKDGNGIPFLSVVPAISKYVREIDRVADEFVRATRHKTSQSGTDPEESPHGATANKAKTSRERYQNQASCGRYHIPGRPAQINDLSIRISISDSDCHAGCYGVIPHLRTGPCERDPKDDEMLQDVDPVCVREGRRQ